jgi:hypothetical protein
VRLARHLSAAVLLLASSGCGDDDPDMQETACRDCLYRGQTSEHELFEVQVEGGAITRMFFNASAPKAACSTGSGCGDVANVCMDIIFDPPADACVLPGNLGCDDCPSSGSCLGMSGTFFAASAHGEIEASFDVSPGCYFSTEPDPLTWTASCVPGATPSACAVSASSERTEFSLPGGRGRVVTVVTP